MREDLLRKYAAELGIINFRPRTANGWLETNCPLAPWTHDKGADRGASFALVINPEGRTYHRCLSCGAKGSFAMLAYRLGAYCEEERYVEIGREIERVEVATVADNLPDWDEEYEAQDKVINRQFLDPDIQYANYPPAFYYQRTQEYMKSRGIRPTTALALNLRYHYSEDRLMFPVYDRNLELRGFSGRAMYTSDDPAHIKVKDYAGLNKEELLLGEDHLFANRSKYKFVVGVEGLIDKAVVHQSGFPNSFALFGNQLTRRKYEKLIDLNLPIIWFVDNDEGGRSFLYGPKDKQTGERDESKSAIKLLTPYFPQMIVKYPMNKRKADPGSLPRDLIKRMIKNAKLVF